MKRSIFLLATVAVCFLPCSVFGGPEEEAVVTAEIKESSREGSNVTGAVNVSTPELNSNETLPVQVDRIDTNVTAEILGENEKNETRANATFKVTCQLNSTDFAPVVEIVNSTKLVKLMQVESNITSPQMPATCVVVLFYSPSCPFSCMAAPHFNALPRVFPDIKIAAVDTSTRYNFNAQYGIVGVPSLLLFHNGRPAARFNNTSDYSLVAFANFITKNTGLKPEGKLFVTSVDFSGPISSIPVKQTDYCLILSWVFIILCTVYLFYHSSLCQWMVDSARSAWREAEAQHHHED